MALRNTDSTYGTVTKLLHLILLLFIFGLLAVGSIMGDLPNEMKGTVYNLHKLSGLIVLVLATCFLIWSFMNIKPGYPAEMPMREIRLARVVRYLMYILIIAMPVSGWLMSSAAGKFPHFFGLFDIPMPGISLDKPFAKFVANIHRILAWTLFCAICLHIAGALKHHIIDKNNILTRMMKF